MSTLGGESKPKGEEWVIVRIPDVHRKLIDGLEPRPRRLSGERVIAEQYIRHALAFASGEPRRHQGVHGREMGSHYERSAGDEHDGALDAAGADVLDCVGAGRRDGQV
nr:Os03g0749200 [Ipomoea trifida]